MRGQALVEFALVVPVLITFIFAIFDLGFYVFVANTVQEASREGARKAIVCTNWQNSQRVIIEQTRGALLGLSASALITPTVVSTPPGASSCSDHVGPSHGATIRVTVTFQYTPITLLIAYFVANSPLTVTGVSTMTVE